MKKKAGVKLLAVLLATSTILSGCGAQETSSRGTGSKEERSDEVITPSTSATREKTEDADETAYAGSDTIIMGSSASVPSSSGSVAGSTEGTTGERTEYSLEDCPALTKLDWDAFNEANKRDSVGFIPDLFEWVGEDPRVDWAEVNECFDEYYGGSEGSSDFYWDMVSSSYFVTGKDEQIGWVYNLQIEPYRTRTENLEYEDLYDKLYNEANADKLAERERILKGYMTYGDMLAGEGIEKYGDDLDALAKYQASLIDTYLSTSSDVQLVEGASYFKVSVKSEYDVAISVVDGTVFHAKPFINANGEEDWYVKDYVYFFDLVQGYLGDDVDYESIVNRDMDYIREHAAAQ